MSNKYVALVTGASRGIGRYTAIFLAHNPNVSHIVLVSRSESELKKLEKELLDINSKLVTKVIAADLGDTKEPVRIISETVSSFGQINLLINNAGLLTTGLISNLSIDQLQKQFQINLFSVIQLTTSAIPYLRVTKGTVFNISSLASQAVLSGASLYAATKIALNHFTAHLAIEEPDIISAAVDPGMVETEMFQVASSDEDMGKHFTEEKVRSVLLQPSVVGKSIAEFAFSIPKEWSGKFIPSVATNEEVKVLGA
jgi:short-subunit dehydrogenase